MTGFRVFDGYVFFEGLCLVRDTRSYHVGLFGSFNSSSMRGLSVVSSSGMCPRQIGLPSSL